MISGDKLKKSETVLNLIHSINWELDNISPLTIRMR